MMAIGPMGYVSPNWADWTVLPGLSVFYDALYSGDLMYAESMYSALVAIHTYSWLLGPDGVW